MSYTNYPKTREDAKSSGATHYFTGKPCKHGHIALRKTKGSCVDCLKVEWEAANISRAAYYSEYNKSDAGKESKRRYYEANKEYVKARANNRPKEAQREYKKKWNQENTGAKNALSAQRRSRRVTATPLWLSAEQNAKIKQLYIQAAKMLGLTGTKHQVDHIIPLQSDTVCGLHVPWNLQLLSVEANQSKGNKYDENLGVAFPKGDGNA
jgi:5-methylcytosine-specific restriction endonuclease McrA